MRCAKSVVGAFVAFGKTRQTIELSQAVHLVTPAGKYLVRVGLVTYVPNQTVVWCIEDIVQSHREFDGTQVGAEVSAGFGYAFQHIGSQLVGQWPELR